MLTRLVAKPLHVLLYGLMVAIAALGLVAFIWHGRAFDFGFASLNLGVTPDRSVSHPAQDFHRWFAYGLFGLIGLHVAAALWHGLVLKDGVMGRMLFGRRTGTRQIVGANANV